MNDDGLISAYLLDEQGGGTPLDWAGLRAWEPGQGPLWAHFDRTREGSRRWLLEESGLDPMVADALLEDETRPHCDVIGEGLLLVLRGVNLNPGADPEDMVSLRLWVEDGRVISLRHRKVMAIDDLRAALAAGRGPKRAAELMIAIAGKLVERMGPVITALDDTVDALEDEVLESGRRQLRMRLHGVRHQAIALRRYIAPQRDAMTRLMGEALERFERVEQLHLREISDRITRYVEDLDAARERAGVVQDELANRLAEEMNRTMYLLSIVATIFLPLGFVTGLLGVNVGGIPGSESPLAFVVLCLLLLGFGLIEVLLFKRLKWF